MRELKPFEWIQPSPVQAKACLVGVFSQAIPTKVVRGDLGACWGLGVAGEHRLTVEFSGRKLHAQCNEGRGVRV